MARRLCLLLGLLVGCLPEGGTPDPCSQYKAALLDNYDCDPAVTTTPVMGTYEAYRCRTEDLDASAEEVLKDCAQYLNQLNSNGECTVDLDQRQHCKSGLLALPDAG